MSWLKVREAGGEGKLRLATLVKVLLSLAGSGDQSHTVAEAESFFSVCIAYHFDYLGVFTKGNPSATVTLSLSNFLHSHSSTRNLTDTLPAGLVPEPTKGL